MDLDHERDRILRQKVRPAQKARMFISRAQELQLDSQQWQYLDSQQWQYLVWTLPVDVLDAVAQIRQTGNSNTKDVVLRMGRSVLWSCGCCIFMHQAKTE